MNSDAEQFVTDVERLIDNDELPNQLNDIFDLAGLQELVTKVYEEVLETIEYPTEGTAEEQANAIRQFTEQVAMKVGAIAALASNTTADPVELAVNSAEAVQVFAALMQNKEVTIKLTTE